MKRDEFRFRRPEISGAERAANGGRYELASELARRSSHEYLLESFVQNTQCVDASDVQRLDDVPSIIGFRWRLRFGGLSMSSTSNVGWNSRAGYDASATSSFCGPVA